jgi:hypothetical protein
LNQTYLTKSKAPAKKKWVVSAATHRKPKEAVKACWARVGAERAINKRR